MAKIKAIHKAVDLSKILQHVFVSTADTTGLPHVAAAGKLSLTSGGRVAIEAWFCPGTVANLEGNRRVALVVWDASRDVGYQLLGEVEEVKELAFLNGYAPETEGSPPSTQVERQLLVRVDKVIGFSHAPHSDVEEGAES